MAGCWGGLDSSVGCLDSSVSRFHGRSGDEMGEVGEDGGGVRGRSGEWEAVGAGSGA